jgi:hypothetical protein
MCSPSYAISKCCSSRRAAVYAKIIIKEEQHLSTGSIEGKTGGGAETISLEANRITNTCHSDGLHQAVRGGGEVVYYALTTRL